MPFSWFHPDLPPQHTRAKADTMYERELKERAALLRRLGYSKAETVLRLRTNVCWDFELHQRPGHLDRIEQLVDGVYKARGMGGGGVPSLEG